MEDETNHYIWQCPFCEENGKAEWSKSCHYEMEEHLQNIHPEETLQMIINKIPTNRLLKRNSPFVWGIIGKNYIHPL